MKLAFLASVAVVALAYVTPVVAAVPDASPVNKGAGYCAAHSAHVTYFDRKRASHLLAARATHPARLVERAHVRPHVIVAAHPAAAPDSGAVRVATLDDRHLASACDPAAVTVLCPGYQLLGIAY